MSVLKKWFPNVLFGTGHFGCVYEGQYIKDGEQIHIAVKSLLHGATSDLANFLKEGIMMKDFKHKHVLQLIGVCIKDGQIPLVVLPFMKLGDLLSYIRNAQNVSIHPVYLQGRSSFKDVNIRILYFFVYKSQK